MVKISNAKQRFKKWGFTLLLWPAVLLTACANHATINTQNNNVAGDQNFENNQEFDNNNQNPFNTKIDPKVLNSLFANQIQVQPANAYGLMQNVDDYYANHDLTTFPIQQAGLEKDVYAFLQSVWLQNERKINVENPTFTNFVYQPITRQIGFRLQVQLSSNWLTTVAIGNQTNLPISQNPALLTIDVANQTLLPTINKVNDRFFLSWLVTKAAFSYHNFAWEVSDLVFNSQNATHAYQTEISLLTNKINYFQLYEQNQPVWTKTIDKTRLQTSIQTQIQDNINTTFKTLVLGNQILNELVKNPTIGQFFTNTARPIANLLANFNLLPTPFIGLLEDVLTIYVKNPNNNSGDEMVKQGLLSIILKHKEALASYIKENLSVNFEETFSKLLADLKPNMSQAEKDEFLNFFNMLPTSFQFLKELLDLFLKDANILDLLQHTLANFRTNITTLFPSNVWLPALLELLNNLLNPSQAFGSQPGVIDILVGQINGENVVISSALNFLQAFNPNQFAFISNLVPILITNNQNFNKTNIINFLQHTVLSFSNLFLANFGFNPNHPRVLDTFTNFYVQSSGYVGDFGYDAKNQLVSFTYQTTLQINRAMSINFVPLKNLLPNQIILAGMQLDKNTLNLIVPNYITFGQDRSASQIVLTYQTAINGTNTQTTPLFFEPKLVNGQWELGYSFNYQLTVFWDDFAAANSISEQFDSQIFGINNPIKTFVTQLLQATVLRSFDFIERLEVLLSGTPLVGAAEYDPDLYITNLTVTTNPMANSADFMAEQALLYDPKDEDNFELIKSRLVTNQQLRWKNRVIDQMPTWGVKPLFNAQNNQLKEQLLTNLYTKSAGFNTNLYFTKPGLQTYNVNFLFNPVFNHILEVSLENLVSIYKFGLTFWRVQGYFPYKVYDLANQTLTNQFTYTLFHLNTY